MFLVKKIKQKRKTFELNLKKMDTKIAQKCLSICYKLRTKW